MIHLIALRLTRGMDLKQQIVQLVQQHRIHAALLRHAWDAYRRCIFALPIVFLPYK